MAEKVLNLEFLWLPREEHMEEINEIIDSSTPETFRPVGPIQKLKSNLSSFCGFPVFVKYCKKGLEFPTETEQETKKTNKTEHALFYLEFHFNVLCAIEIEKRPEDDFKKFINLFCTGRNSTLSSELYLKLNSTCFTIETDINTHHRARDLARFSLGNFTGLNTFNERFDSKTSVATEGYKITQNRLVLLHDYKKLIMYFVVGKIKPVKKRNSTTHCLFKLEILYSSLHSLVISRNEGLTVFIRIIQPPLMYSVIQEKDDDVDYTSFHELSYKTPWFRTVDLHEDAPPYLRKEFTMNTVLRLDLKNDEYDFLFQLRTHCKSIQIFFAPVTVLKSLVPISQPQFDLDEFECYYALQCLLSCSFEVHDQLVVRNQVESLKQFLEEKTKENPFALSTAMYLVFDAIIKGNFVLVLNSLKFLYLQLSYKPVRSIEDGFSQKTPEQKHMLLIKKAILTPTHVHFLPPQPTLKSRALRDCKPDYSLRLAIREVDMNTLNFTLRAFGADASKFQKDFFNKYIRPTLLKGINIGNRCYKYVGSSTSQLKGHGLWFYAKDNEHKTANDLRKAFGKLEEIRHVSKFMARMGQTFSQSMGYILVPQELTNVKTPEEDIKRGTQKYVELHSQKKFLIEKGKSEQEEKEEPYIFSDGIGKISLELAEQVYKELDVEDSRPSAMQIRYAGCKGMLVVDPTLKGKQIVFRKSMAKFISDNENLEILKFSEKRSAFLNRPFITILEHLGIKKEVFLQLQKEMIQNHITSMFHESQATHFLHRHSLLRFDFLAMHSAGIHFTEDPLFRSMIYSLFQKQIQLLKNKANIEIPVDKGRSMFGVLDETFTLEYGQVFVQYSEWETDRPIIHTGTVVVTKNPCMHPGDVRKFEAVDVEALHHIVDCIVFPAKGDRPHPDEMAGSDLDGDEYHVMWMKELTFERDNHQPMDFGVKYKPKILDRDVEITDEVDHICDYLFNDKVGLIGSSHLVWADQLKDSVSDETCLALAKQYSFALDFAKSGIPVPPLPNKVNGRAFKVPDFMQKLDEKRTYLSIKALGFLFRSCKRLELGLETEKNEIEYKLDKALVHEDWDKKYKKSALRVYKQYCDKIELFIRTYGFENEGQLLAGALINPPKYYENRHDLSNLTTLLEFEVQWIFHDLKRKFFDEFGGKPKDGIFTENMLQKASAWYMVSYKKKETGSQFFGLPWAVADVLVELKLLNQTQVLGRKKVTKTILEDIVDKSVAKHYPKLSPETDVMEIYDSRFQVLDIALKILSRWVRTQREYFTDHDLKKVEKCIGNEFETLTMDIATCDVKYIKTLKKSENIKRAISPCYHVIETLLHVAKIGTEQPQLQVSDVSQEIGLLAWMTLIKLACTYNPQYLGIPNQAGEYATTVFYKPQDNIIDTLQLPLFEKNNEANIQFSMAVTRNYEEVKQYLKEQTKVKNIDYRIVQLMDSDFVRITVEGTRYSIERLKDIVVMKEFFESVANNKPLAHV